MTIKVAIDSGPLTSGHSVRGIGVMVKEQIEAIKRFSNNEVTLDPFDFSTDEGIEKLENGNYDIVHYTTFFPYALTLPEKKYGKKTVVTIQDLIHLLYPTKYPPGVRGKINLLKQRQRLKNIDHVITISETSKKDIVRLLGMPQEKVTKIYIVPDPHFQVIKDKRRLSLIKKKYNLPDQFVFNLGDVNYNKNIPTLIEACELVGIPLVLGGKHAKEIENMAITEFMHMEGPMDYMRFLFNKPHPEHAHYMGLIEKFKTSKNIIRLGFVPDDDLAEIMNLATVYCQPSYYEGFGLSVLHALICGTPSVISRTNCLVEIFGSACLIADPNSAKDLASKINESVNNEETRKKLIKKGFHRAKYFNHEKMGKELIEVYKKIARS